MSVDEKETPFQPITPEEFSALTDVERMAYLRRRNNDLALRAALLNKQKNPQKKS